MRGAANSPGWLFGRKQAAAFAAAWCFCFGTGPLLAAVHQEGHHVELRNGKLELELEQGTLTVQGDFVYRQKAETLEISSRDCLAISVSDFVEGDFQLAATAFDLCPQRGHSVVRFSQDRLDLTGQIKAWPLDLRQAGEPLVKGTTPAFNFEAALSLGERARLSGDWQAQKGALAYGQEALLSGFAVEGSFDWLLGQRLTAKADVRRATVEDAAPAGARFAEMVLSGPVSYARNELSWRLDVRPGQSSSGSPAIGRLTGSHDLQTAKGKLTAEGALIFSPSGLQPRELSPLVPDVAKQVSGRIDYEVQAGWAANGLTSSARTMLDGLGFNAAGTPISGVGGEIVFASLAPLKTQGPQTLRINTIGIGIPLEFGRVTFDMPGDETLRLEEALWPFANGMVVVSSEPFALTAKEQKLQVTLSDVDLSALVQIANLPGLSGTGILEGTVPVLIRDGTPVFERGDIASTKEGGIIRYTGVGDDVSQAGGEASILVNALRNFHYKQLSAHLSGDDDDVELLLTLEGSNPDLYDGYPFQINIRTRGDLAELIRQGSAGFRPFDLIQQEGVDVEKPPE